MKIILLCIGKLREKFWQDAYHEYDKRFGNYGSLEVREIPSEKLAVNISEAEISDMMEKEGKKILKIIDSLNQSFVVCLDAKGTKMNSESFAAFLQTKRTQGTRCMVFVIGGANGLSSCVLQRSHMQLSFSDFIFPHQLMRVILAEQLYRAMKIIHKEPYHR